MTSSSSSCSECPSLLLALLGWWLANSSSILASSALVAGWEGLTFHYMVWPMPKRCFSEPQFLMRESKSPTLYCLLEAWWLLHICSAWMLQAANSLAEIVTRLNFLNSPPAHLETYWKEVLMLLQYHIRRRAFLWSWEVLWYAHWMSGQQGWTVNCSSHLHCYFSWHNSNVLRMKAYNNYDNTIHHHIKKASGVHQQINYHKHEEHSIPSSWLSLEHNKHGHLG